MSEEPIAAAAAAVLEPDCRRPDLVALSNLQVDVATVAGSWEPRLDYVDEVEVAGAVLQYEQYAERLGVFDAVAQVGQLWKDGRLRFGDARIGGVAAVDVLYNELKNGERVAPAQRAELYSRVRSTAFEAGWRQLMPAIRDCLTSCCDSDGLCGAAPVTGVLLAAERMHSVVGRAFGEYDMQLAKELSCQLDDALAILSSEPVIAACSYGDTLPDALSWLDEQAGRPVRDRYPEVAFARALEAIFDLVARPTVDEVDGEGRYRSMIEKAAVLFPAESLRQSGSGHRSRG